MPLDLTLTLAIVFVTTGVLAGSISAMLLLRLGPARRRLEQLTSPRQGAASPIVVPNLTLTDAVNPAIERVSRLLPTSPKELSRIRRRLARAGFHAPEAAVIYAALEVGLPILLGGTFFLLLGTGRGLVVASLAAIVGYLLPGLLLGRMVTARQEQIRNGLPDALDLIIVCVEAGLSLDQAIQKTSEELAISHPILTEELHAVINEIRAGKPRMDAFRNFAERTKVDDVRALVAMLIQTDRFGTSIAQALRIHADGGRTTRRQRAEERAAKLGVKLVFPLVFCLFPALYVITLGPGAIRILRVIVQGLGAR
jgi:tight adherence protein C